MPGTILFLNDFDTSRLGFVVERYEGAGGTSLADRPSQAVLERAGEVDLDGVPIHRPRTITIQGTLRATTVAAARANLEALRERFSRARLELRFIDQPDRVFFAYRRETKHDPLRSQAIKKGCRLTFDLNCLDAYAYATQPTAVGLSSTPAVCPLGRSPSAPVIQLMGSATDPVVRYRRNDGAVLSSLTFTGLSLGATEYLVLDCEAALISRYTNGVYADGANLLTAGRLVGFALNPAHGDPESGDWPTLEVTSGSGVALYRKAYG